MHPTKLLSVSQLHIFTILAVFPAFLSAPPLLRAFDFPAAVAAKPPTVVAFLLYQVRLALSPRSAPAPISSLPRSRFPISSANWDVEAHATHL